MKTIRTSFLIVATTAMLTYAAPASLDVAPVLAVTTQQAQPSPRQQEDEFVPVKDLENQEQLPATPLVIGAYAVAWIAVFLYLWSIWRRLSRVEGEIASLSRRVAENSRSGARH